MMLNVLVKVRIVEVSITRKYEDWVNRYEKSNLRTKKCEKKCCQLKFGQVNVKC